MGGGMWRWGCGGGDVRMRMWGRWECGGRDVGG